MVCGLFQQSNGGGLYKVDTIGQRFPHKGRKSGGGVTVYRFRHGVPVLIQRATCGGVGGGGGVVQRAAVKGNPPFQIGRAHV